MGFFELILAIAIGIILGFYILVYILAGGLESILWIVGLIIIGTIIFDVINRISIENIFSFVGLIGFILGFVYIFVRFFSEVEGEIKGKTIRGIIGMFLKGIIHSSIFKKPKNFDDYCISGIVWISVICIAVAFLFVFVSFLVK